MIRNRWTERVLRCLVLAALAGLVGCKQQLFLDPGDYADMTTVGLPPAMQTNPHQTITPPVIEPTVTPPATVMDPNRPPRYVTLKECIAIALEQGNVGTQSQQQFGFKNETGAQFNGRSVVGTDAIRAFSIDPAVAQADIERSLSKFDARWVTSMTWQKVDQPVAAQFLSFQQQRDAASLNSSLIKPLPTGGLAGVTFSVDYSKFPSNTQLSQLGNFVNPNYTPRVQFNFEQPLLQLFGVEVNQLAPSHPGSITQNVRPSGGQGTEGILISRIRLDQANAEFNRTVNFQLINVEAAYWNLYGAYYNLYAREEGLRQSYEGYRFTKARVESGSAPMQELNQARAQLELFRGEVYSARGQILESERQLRGFLGLRSDDGQRLVPIDEPNLAPFQPDYYEAANEAMAYKPRLLQARQEVMAAQLNLRLQREFRRPDLRVFANYDIAGLGTRLDGSELTGPGGLSPGNAFASLGNNQFNSWSIGLRLDMPLGFRDGNALVRQANLQLARTYIQLRDEELKTLEFLTSRYRRVAEAYALIPPLRIRRQQLQEFVARIRTRIEIGQFRTEEYFNYLQVQRDLADSIAQEFRAIAVYNTAIAEFEFAKGTIMRYNNVTLSDAPLPAWVAKRAKDHERERTEAAIKLRERHVNDPAPVSPAHLIGPATNGPAIVGPEVGTPTIPGLTDMLQEPRPVEPKKEPGMPEPKGPEKKPAADAGTGARLPQSLPQPLPLPTETPGAIPAGPDPNSFFAPSGTVNVPRFNPIRPPAGRFEAPPKVPVPTPSPTSGLPKLNTPGFGDGIPPTLPSTGVADIPTVPPLPTSTTYPPN
jgi:outer membrane protein TolC